MEETSYLQNIYLTKEDLKNYEEIIGTDPTMRAVYLENKWAEIRKGTPYYYNFSAEKHITKSIPEPNPKAPLHVSFDFNSNPYITCLVYQPTATGYVQLDEICLEHPRSNSYDVTLFFRDKYKEILKNNPDVYIHGDPAGKHKDTRNDINDYEIIKDILSDYKRIDCVLPSAPGLKARYGFINRALSGFYPDIDVQIGINCIKTIEDFNHIQYDGEGAKIKEHQTLPSGIVCERLGHCSDAFDYFLLERYKEQFEAFKRPLKKFEPIYGKREVLQKLSKNYYR